MQLLVLLLNYLGVKQQRSEHGRGNAHSVGQLLGVPGEAQPARASKETAHLYVFAINTFNEGLIRF